LFVLAALFPSRGACAEAGGSRIERLDPALDALVAPEAKVEVLASGPPESETQRSSSCGPCKMPATHTATRLPRAGGRP
jgi:hypothetical protein